MSNPEKEQQYPISENDFGPKFYFQGTLIVIDIYDSFYSQYWGKKLENIIMYILIFFWIRGNRILFLTINKVHWQCFHYNFRFHSFGISCSLYTWLWFQNFFFYLDKNTFVHAYHKHTYVFLPVILNDSLSVKYFKTLLL